jgi:hypothetical protein|tara:strand:- start:83 stop:238 length:156 start_codon:yes stop_codon:yes gene_type:complete
MSSRDNISPDGKWKIIVENNQVKWVELTVNKDQYTIQELVDATKRILPEIW